MQRLIRLGFTMLALFLFSFAVHADTSFTKRKDVQLFIKEMVKKYHFNARQLTATLNQVTIQPQIIESMERPFEKNLDVVDSVIC